MLKIKYTLTEMKNDCDGLIRTLDTVEERMFELLFLLGETSKTEK